MVDAYYELRASLDCRSEHDYENLRGWVGYAGDGFFKAYTQDNLDHVRLACLGSCGGKHLDHGECAAKLCCAFTPESAGGGPGGTCASAVGIANDGSSNPCFTLPSSPPSPPPLPSLCMDENTPNDPNYCQNEIGTLIEKVTKCKDADFIYNCERTCGYCRPSPE